MTSPLDSQVSTPPKPDQAIPVRCIADFELNIAKAIADQLEAQLASLVPESFANAAVLDALPPRPGIYRLFYNDDPVYVGKADQSLRDRLKQHARDIDGRENIARTDVSFICATLSNNWAPFGTERILMKHAPHTWQNSGFGNNDPGRERDTSKIKPKHWDAKFPIRLHWRCDRVTAGTYQASDLLDLLKGSLPFLLRFQRAGVRKHEAEVARATVEIPADAMGFWQLMALIVAQLPGWQATALPGYAILYRENRRYQSALSYLPSKPEEPTLARRTRGAASS